MLLVFNQLQRDIFMKLPARKVSHIYVTFLKRCAMQRGTHPANQKQHDIKLACTPQLLRIFKM
jgi:hypothetical protein